jgi:GNAT superfamily N-acetyltransferase
MATGDQYAAAQAMAHAFVDDPTTTFFYGGTRETRLPLLERMFGIGLGVRADMEQPTPIAVDGDHVVGAALIALPEEPKWTEERAQRWDAFEASLDPAIVERFALYNELKKAHRPEAPHAYVLAIGVHPEHQGKGLGRALLEETARLARDQPTLLDTMNPSNIAIYERSGYAVVAESSLGGIPIWFMRRG